MVEITTAKEVKEALNATAAHLSGVPYASKSLLFVAASIKKYIEGKESSLDRAFGLTLGRGKYKRKDEEKHILMIRNAIETYLNVNSNGDVVRGKPMKTIAELNGYDEKEFKRLFDRYKSQAFERIAAEIDFSDL